jgi:Uma2 family endonuclease
MAQRPLTVRRWSREEYDRLATLGLCGDAPLELIGGQLVVAEPQGSRHAASVGLVGAVLSAALPRGWAVRIQAPLALDDESVPEPDVAVVEGSHADYRRAHPRRAALVVEVAEASLAFDRAVKASLYASGGVKDYWIVNVAARELEVYREPVPNPSAPCGWSFRSTDRFSPHAAVAPLAMPAIRIATSRFL